MTSIRRFEPHPSHQADRLRGLPLASFWRRGAALALDFFVAAVLYAFVGFFMVKVAIAAGLYHPAPDQDITIRLGFFDHWYNVLWLVLFLGLSNHVGNGRTLGKRMLRIRAVSLTHERLRGWQAIERALAYGASALELGFGFVQYFFNPNRQTVHDRIAETIVLDERPGTPHVTP